MFGLKRSNFGRATAVLIVLAMLFAMTAAIAYGAPGGQPKSAAAWAAELLKEATNLEHPRGWYVSQVARNMDKDAIKEDVINYLVEEFDLVFSSSMGIFAALSSSNEKVDVLVGFNGNSGRSENRGLVRAYGGEIYAEFTIVDVIAAQMTQKQADALAKNPNVRYVEPDGLAYAIGQTVPWGIDRVFDVDFTKTGNEYDSSYRTNAWGSSTKGSGIGVAVLDTGIANHEDLVVAGGFNAIKGASINNYHDGNGHGTHVAGTIAARDNEKGVVGVSPLVDLYAVKVLGDNGSGSISDIVNGIQWTVNNEIPIINMSLGTSSHFQTLKDACDNAYSAGVLLVAAAGNSGNPGGGGDHVGYPARYSSVIAVAASDDRDRRASFSSTGPAVELIAPGVGINSTWPAWDKNFNGYRSLNGTSMASPHVAGAAALVWAVDPELNNDEVRTILRNNTEDLSLPFNHQGYGLVRADLAVNYVLDADSETTSATINPATAEFDLDSMANVTTTITWNDAELLEYVKIEENELVSNTDYKVETAGNTTTLTILSEFFTVKDPNADDVIVFTIGFDVGDDAVFTVTVIDTSVPPVTYTVTFNLDPYDAVVEVKDGDNNVVTSEDDHKIYELEAGEYSYSVSKTGYVTETGIFTVTDENKTITVMLVEADSVANQITFELTNTSNPAWARVTVDWEVRGSDIASVIIKMKLNGDEKDSKTVSVNAPYASGTDELRTRGGHGLEYHITVTLYDAQGILIDSLTKNIIL